jgi:hypothetical protein
VAVAAAAHEETDPRALLDLAMCRIKVCPHCNVLLTRSHGCDSMWCVCGQQFHYRSARDLVPEAQVRKVRLALALHWTLADVAREGFTGESALEARHARLGFKVRVRGCCAGSSSAATLTVPPRVNGRCNGPWAATSRQPWRWRWRRATATRQLGPPSARGARGALRPRP